MLHWLSQAFSTYVLHVQNHNGYQFWSGFGSDLGEATLIGIALGAWRHVNCHAPRCLRFGKHPTADHQHKLCRKHHPDLPNRKLSLGEIHDRHFQARVRAVDLNEPIGHTTTKDGSW